MNKPMRIVICRPGDTRPIVRIIDGTLTSMQEVVGGYIESVVLLPGRLALICNEEGRLISLPLNRRVCGHDIYGTFFLCKPTADDLAGLSTDEARLLLDGLDWSGEITA